MTAADAGPPEAAILPPDFRSRFQRAGARFVSRGHGERFEGVVWVNDAARPWLAGARDAPDGAILVEEAFVRDRGGDTAAGLFVMERAEGAWRFAVIGADASVVNDGRTGGCVTCHSEAPSAVFPLVAPAP